MRKVGLLLGFIALGFGCGEAGITMPTTDTMQVADTPVAVDTTEAVDTAVSADTTLNDVPPSACEPGQGCFGEPCDSGQDCLSEICTMHLGDQVCSKTCDATCPKGWGCRLVGSGGDSAYVCLSDFSHLCMPCSDAGTCSGDKPNACVSYADGTSFCGGACDVETPCPSDYKCQEVTTTDGAKSYQCVFSGGVCACSNLAIESALATPCEATNDIGTCEGVRICEADGLSACSATPPTEETCNGVDDDCNGLTDENTCDDGNDCTVDTCAGADGCSHELLDEGECLDGDVCTVGDHCEAGVCVGKTIDCDDENPCTEDSCDGLGGCISVAVVALCDDGDPCTLGDLCVDGACAGSAVLTCEDGNVCTADSCGESGCVFTPQDAACDDGNACTEGDGCVAGACEGTALVCDDATLCTNDGCDVKTGCTSVNNTQPCDDGDTCTLQDVCADGSCASGAKALTCDDGNPCTDDACDSGLGCVFIPNDGACDDNNACTLNDVCKAGNCGGTGALGCDDGNPCTLDTCLLEGGCDHQATDGGCSDGDACTANDNCVQGQCVVGASVGCDDNNPCTEDSCDAGDCVFTQVVAPCDDGNACTSVSLCESGACVGAEGEDCNDNNNCTDDGCDPSTGCTHEPNTQPCDDGNACTLGDACDTGECTAGGQTLNCNDGNPCTDDVCDFESGCVFTVNTAVCDDSDPCSVGDVCAEGVCQKGPETFECDDGVFCNGAETCAPGEGCQSGEVPDVSDGFACTIDSCDPVTDSALHTPDDSSCGAIEGCQTGVCDVNSGCTVAPLTPCCGNGEVEADEQCDDGDLVDDNGCTNECNETPIGEQQFLTPGQHVFVVPDSVTKITALAVGGGGSGNYCGGCTGGGGGGGSKSIVDVTPGQEITVVVGRGGGNTGTPAVHLDGGNSSVGAPVNVLATGGRYDGSFGQGSGGNLHNSRGGSAKAGENIHASKTDGVPEESGDGGGAGASLNGFVNSSVGNGLGVGGGGGGQNCVSYGGSCAGGQGGSDGFLGGSAGQDGGGPSGGKTGNPSDNNKFCQGHSYYNGGGGGSYGAGGGNDGSGQGAAACALGLYLGGDGAHGYVRISWSLSCVNCCGNGLVEEGETCDDGNLQGNDGCGVTCQPDGPDCGGGLAWNGVCVFKAPKFVNCATQCAQQGLSCKDDTMKWFGLAENHQAIDAPCDVLCPGVEIFLGGADCSQAPYCAAWGCAYCADGISTTCQSSHDDQKLCPCE
jgi:cysteine-rich repeat protein